MSMAETATELFDRHNSDKGWYHHYGNAYDALFADRRYQVQRVLELGIFEGASLRAWADYFPEAKVWGVDLKVPETPSHERITMLQGDAAGPKMLSKLRALGPFDVIIDDASHTIEDQLASLLGLWHALADGGLYVIEDHIDPSHFYTLTHLPGADLLAFNETDRGSLLVVRKP